MFSNIRLASYPPKGKDKEAIMPQKIVVLSLVVICVTIVMFTWITRNTLCELRIRQGSTEVAAIMACDSLR
ncbi:Hok/Gef family protein [Rahnella sp. SAP-1]|uniref:Hok/Gef family protein n=2 Tax=Rouxiella aceris TaxID=2703884 RepID=A0A848MKT0_9GAMM|nr:Hok/Gef family protein [Rouxiella aceris]